MPKLPPSSNPAAAAGPCTLGRSLAVVLACGLVAWWETWNGAFVFDDHPAIEGNAALLGGDWWHAAFAPPHQPLANRPLATLSIAFDFLVFGVGPFGPHLTNVLLQLGNGVLLLVLLRRVFAAPNLAGTWAAPRGDVLALAIAALWVVHPLTGDAVAYATQRSTLLFSGCLLLSLWAVLRGWRWLVVLACAAGMASKEDFVGAPLVLPLFLRAFVVPEWRHLRAWRGTLLGAVATWSVLAACLALGPSNPTVGAGTALRVTPLQWLCTEAPVVLHYLRLALVPWPLRPAYDWDFVRSATAALVPGALVLALLAATVWAWRRRPWLGFLGAWWFLLLAPTSSVLPIVTEVVAERRAYLPMLAVIVPVVVFVARRVPASPALGVAALAALVAGAWQRVGVYHDEPAFWADAYQKRDVGSRSHLAAQILSNHGAMLFNQGQVDAASTLFDEAMACESPTVEERVHHAVSLQVRGRSAEAVAAFEKLVAEFPDAAEAHGSFGTTLLQLLSAGGNPAPGDPRLPRAEHELRRATELAPRRPVYWNSLGCVLEMRQQWQPAEAAYRQAAQQGAVPSLLGLARVLVRLGKAAEAVGVLRLVPANTPQAAEAAAMLRQLGQ